MSTQSSVRERISVLEKKASEITEQKRKGKKTPSVAPVQTWQRLDLCSSTDAPLGILRPLMIALEISCHGLLWMVATLTTLLCIHKPYHIEIVFNLFVGLIVDMLLVAFLKLIVQRQRPANNSMDMFATVKVDQYSFPSGHATRACYLAMFIANQASHAQRLVLFTSVWAGFVCLSRLLLGRHHFSDVLCGCVIGTVEFYVLNMLWISQTMCAIILKPLLGEFI